MTTPTTYHPLYTPTSLTGRLYTWTNQAGDEIRGHLADVTILTDGAPLLTGTAVDEYGWWHRRVTVDLTNVRDLRAVGHAYPQPEPAPFPVTPTFEWRRGLIRLVIPDAAALRLNDWKNANWHEVTGYATGYTDPAKRGTWVHRALAYLHSIESHLTCTMPFIQGESFDGMKDEHGHAPAEAYDLFVTTCGVAVDTGNPTRGFHFTG